MLRPSGRGTPFSCTESRTNTPSIHTDHAGTAARYSTDSPITIHTDSAGAGYSATTYFNPALLRSPFYSLVRQQLLIIQNSHY